MYGRKRTQSDDFDEIKQDDSEGELVQYIANRNRGLDPFYIVNDYILCSLDVATVKQICAQRPEEEKLTKSQEEQTEVKLTSEQQEKLMQEKKLNQEKLHYLVVSAKSINDFLVAVQIIADYSAPLFSSKPKDELLKDELINKYFNESNGYTFPPPYLDDLIENEKMIRSLGRQFKINQDELLTMEDVLRKYDQCLDILNSEINKDMDPYSKKLPKLKTVLGIFNDHLDKQAAVYSDACSPYIFERYKLRADQIRSEIVKKEGREPKHYDVVRIQNKKIQPYKDVISECVQNNEWPKLKSELEEYKNRILYKLGFDKFIEKNESSRSYAVTKREEFERSKHESSRRKLAKSAPEFATEFSSEIPKSKREKKTIISNMLDFLKSDKTDSPDDKQKKTGAKPQGSKF